MTIRAIAFLALAFAVLAPCAAADPTVVFLVRHGEKLTGDDPDLSPAGHARAQNIAAVLKKSGITKIFTTPFKRTRQTAQPLASALGLQAQVYEAAKSDKLVEDVKAMRGVVLVVGHSNTLPKLVTLFGGVAGGDIDEATEFDRLYQLIIERDGSVTTVLLSSLPTTP
jgi:broad specificity phosphatase PhoE